jgi:hypothetical protein
MIQNWSLCSGSSTIESCLELCDLATTIVYKQGEEVLLLYIGFLSSFRPLLFD